MMKRKRLDRDVWWEHNKVKFPRYYQMRIDIDEFHGLVCLLHLIDGQPFYWDLPKAGKAAVIGKGMTWLQLVPDGKSHVLTAKYLPEKKTIQGVGYSHSVSLWYADIIENIEYDSDGVAVFIDKYLDVCFTPQGDVIVDDRDELDEAFQSGELTKEQYESALHEGDLILGKYCSDIEKTEVICGKILAHANKKIKDGEDFFQKQSTEWNL